MDTARTRLETDSFFRFFETFYSVVNFLRDVILKFGTEN